MHSVLRVYKQLISYTWAKPSFQATVVEAGKRENVNTAISKSYTQRNVSMFMHIHQHKLLCHKAQAKPKYDTNLTMIILKMSQVTSELVSACFSELQHPHTSKKCCLLICLSKTMSTLQKPCSVSHLLSETMTMQFPHSV